MKKVLVIMPVYNAADYLHQAVDSVLNQTFTDWRLVAVDDGSSDPRVGEILWKARANHTDPSQMDVHLLYTAEYRRRESVRYATIINEYASHSDEPFITILCGDDYYELDRLERMVAKIEEGHDVVYGAQRMVREDGTQLDTRPCRGVLRRAYHQVDLNSIMVRRTAFNKVGGFPTEPSPRMWREADGHFWNRLTDAGFWFVPVDQPELPTDCKRYRARSVDARVIRGELPW